jgi:hypothetical protein
MYVEIQQKMSNKNNMQQKKMKMSIEEEFWKHLMNFNNKAKLDEGTCGSKESR